jgi:hypothetical protein
MLVFSAAGRVDCQFYPAENCFAAELQTTSIFRHKRADRSAVHQHLRGISSRPFRQRTRA